MSSELVPVALFPMTLLFHLGNQFSFHGLRLVCSFRFFLVRVITGFAASNFFGLKWNPEAVLLFLGQ